ncbi:neurotrypsin-like isoform X2 [Ptychodera flava]|uniref:neurotrypsin-like isoform X2 n=1 Tax=Ptychodera flava TaxID=63121 RepID=UPI00396A4CC2
MECSHSTGGDDCGSSNPTVSCDIPENGDVRIVDGLSANVGRIEIFHEGEWRRLCYPDEKTAAVACKQLGYGAAVIDRTTYVNVASIPALPYSVQCNGYESNIMQCTRHEDDETQMNCISEDDIYIQCKIPEERDLRLVNGNSPNEGRLEIYHNSQWGSVCDDDFSPKNVRVVCRQLGYLPGTFRNHAAFGEASSNIWLDDVNCTGLEEKLSSCANRDWGTHDCKHHEDVSVLCKIPDEHDIRLVGGDNIFEGRLEIIHEGNWGTVCDDEFEVKDAVIVCKQLGYSGGTVKELAYFGEGTGTIWLDEVKCVDGKTHLADCDHAGWGEHDCEHNEDVGVVCSPP